MTLQSQKEIWCTFVGIVDTPITRKLAELFTNAAFDKVTKIHFLIQSPGGNVNDGVFIFNFLNGFPVDVVAYNNGNVSSAATIAFLGAKKRLVSSDGTFMIHRTKAAPGNIGHAQNLQAITDSVEIDDARTEAILKTCCKLTPKQWKVFTHSDLTLDANTSVAAGIAHEIGQFKPNGPMFFI